MSFTAAGGSPGVTLPWRIVAVGPQRSLHQLVGGLGSTAAGGLKKTAALRVSQVARRVSVGNVVRRCGR
ncbi:MAG: hypothetical protein CM15mP68_0330 [Pseudomonadota bacterium]|nr:MAG: hypothetical protein CM15mP68_0330 [Pseudomonadota bacterium]